jgi:hypothetical protein
MGPTWCTGTNWKKDTNDVTQSIQALSSRPAMKSSASPSFAPLRLDELDELEVVQPVTTC